MSDSLVGFVMKGAEVVKIIHPKSPDDVVVGIGGDLRAVDWDGEVFIYAAGEWTEVKIRES